MNRQFSSKTELRKFYKKVRLDVHRGLSVTNKEIILRTIRERLIKVLSTFNLPYKFNLAGYYSIQSELDCLKILLDIQKSSLDLKFDICLPKMVNDNELKFYSYEGEHRLIKGKLNLLEPNPLQCVEVRPDVIITPLLAFDRNKHRLGYGKGCYDITFTKLNATGHKFLTIGIGYDEQYCNLELLPSEETDYALDYVITPSYML